MRKKIGFPPRSLSEAKLLFYRVKLLGHLVIIAHSSRFFFTQMMSHSQLLSPPLPPVSRSFISIYFSHYCLFLSLPRSLTQIRHVRLSLESAVDWIVVNRVSCNAQYFLVWYPRSITLTRTHTLLFFSSCPCVSRSFISIYFSHSCLFLSLPPSLTQMSCVRLLLESAVDWIVVNRTSCNAQ